jgi:hypothetical protein
MFFHTILHYPIFYDIVEHSLSCATRLVPNSIKTNKDTHMETWTQIKKTQLQKCKNLNSKKKKKQKKKKNLFLLCVLNLFSNMKNVILNHIVMVIPEQK